MNPHPPPWGRPSDRDPKEWTPNRITITPDGADVSFASVNAYYTWCDRFAFRVRFKAGAEILTAVAELNVTREEPYREPERASPATAPSP